jgi:hypothetical protein
LICQDGDLISTVESLSWRFKRRGGGLRRFIDLVSDTKRVSAADLKCPSEGLFLEELRSQEGDWKVDNLHFLQIREVGHERGAGSLHPRAVLLQEGERRVLEGRVEVVVAAEKERGLGRSLNPDQSRERGW